MYGALSPVAPSHSRTVALVDIARAFTPRVEICGSDVVFDLAGLTRLFGHPRDIGHELRRMADARALSVGIAIAGTCTAARLLALSHPANVIVIEPGAEAAAMARLPLELLGRIDSRELVGTFRRWGIRTCGQLAALPPDAIAARLGADGVRWHRLAQGQDLGPLRPSVSDEQFEQALDLEWPIEGLEPLAFVLGRLLEPLAEHLERRGRGAAVLRLQLHLVTRAVHERSLQLPAPMRDARALRTLLLLDLESHPPPAAIDRVVVAADPTPGRVLQFSLLTKPFPSPEQLSTLNARLAALMGEGRCGSPVAVDSWQPGAFGMTMFDPQPNPKSQTPNPNEIPRPKAQSLKPEAPCVALRRFRFPVPARVHVEHETPVRVTTDRRGMTGGRVETCAGPWRTSGNWWATAIWNRDEWDVTLGDGATYRIFRDRATSAWFVDAVVD